jgi:hypothetical protein
MKKRLLVLSLALMSLCFAVTFSGCGALMSYCNYTGGPPNTPYIITYSDLSVGTGRVNPDGTFRVLKHGGENCNQLRLRVGFGNNLGLALSASPSSVYLPSPPTSGTITGQSFDATYGMPRVDYFDSNGYLVGSVNATSVASNGTSLQANMPDLSYVYSGTYQVKVTNKRYDGYYLTIVGSAAMTGWGRDRLDSDGDGWYDDEDCAPDDPSFNYDCSATCGGYDNVPRYICNDQPL